MIKEVSNALKLKAKHKEFVYSRFPQIIFESKKTNFNSRKYGKASRHKVTVKFRTNLNPLMSQVYFVFAVSSKTRIEIQTYRVIQFVNFETKKEVFDFTMVGLDVVGESVKYFRRDTWTNRFQEGKYTLAGQGWYRENYHYDLEIDDIENSPLEFTGLTDVSIDRIVPSFCNRIQLERLHVAGLKLLHRDLYEGNFNKGILTERRIKKYRKFIKNHDLDYEEAVLMIRFKEHRIHPNIEVLKYLPKNLNPNFKQHNWIRLLNYLQKNKQYYDYYMDYFNVMIEIGSRPIEDLTIYPKNLVEAHDKAVDLLNEMKRVIEVENAIARSKEMEILEWQNDEYIVIAPTCPEDLIHEGNILSHCVGSKREIENYYSRRKDILFIRKVSEPTVPFFTMTHRKGKITEINGYKNHKTDRSEIKKIMNDVYLPAIKERIKNEKRKEI